MLRLKRFVFVLGLISVWTLPLGTFAQMQLERELLNTSIKQLAAQAVESGSPERGAILFHSTNVGCAQCHRLDVGPANAIGPILAQWNKSTTKPMHESVIESILRPSAIVAPQFASTRILTSDGNVITGVVTSRNSKEVQVRFGPKPEDQANVAVDDIDR